MNFTGYDVKQVRESDVLSELPLLEHTDAEECRIRIGHEEKVKVKENERKKTRFPLLKNILRSFSKYKLHFTQTHK